MPEHKYTNIFNTWSVTKEQQKADFMEHLFECYQPANHCYTGLWERFCMTEAGDYCRDMYFQRLKALDDYLKEQEKQKEVPN